jgi:hypothetical protein
LLLYLLETGLYKELHKICYLLGYIRFSFFFKQTPLLMKKIIIITAIALLTLGFFVQNGNNANAQVASGFSPIPTDCYSYQTPLEDPVVVGHASNCSLGGTGCVDSSCGAGAIEVQRQIAPGSGGN